MVIEYENKFRDLFLFNTVHQFMSPVAQIFYLGVALFVTYLGEMESSPVFYFVMVLIGYLAAWGIQALFNLIYLVSRDNHTFLTKHIMEIREDGIFDKTKYYQSLYFWTGVTRIVRRSGFIAIYVNQNAAHIIPNRAFGSKEECEQFYRGVKLEIAHV
jgi:hypothetical protein